MLGLLSEGCAAAVAEVVLPAVAVLALVLLWTHGCIGSHR